MTPLLAFGLCVLLHGIAVRIFPRWKLLDFPQRYGLKRAPLPYPTGILCVASFLLLFVLLYWPLNMQQGGVFLGVFLLGIACFIDDRYTLSPTWRLLLQILIAFIIFATGSRIYTITNPLETLTGNPFLKLDSWTFALPIVGSLPIISGVFTLVWLLLTINALNWFDGIPGQVNAISTVGFLAIALLSLSTRVSQPELAALALLLAGIAAAAFLFDFPPPRVVMGDTGAMFFGLLLGTLTIFSGGKVATAFLVLGFPLIDSVFVVLHRVLHGKSPLKGSQTGEHLHHRLLGKGWSPRSIIALSTGLGIAFGTTALFLSTFEKFVAALLLLLCMAGLWWYSKPAKNS